MDRRGCRVNIHRWIAPTFHRYSVRLCVQISTWNLASCRELISWIVLSIRFTTVDAGLEVGWLRDGFWKFRFFRKIDYNTRIGRKGVLSFHKFVAQFIISKVNYTQLSFQLLVEGGEFFFFLLFSRGVYDKETSLRERLSRVSYIYIYTYKSFAFSGRFL